MYEPAITRFKRMAVHITDKPNSRLQACARCIMQQPLKGSLAPFFCAYLAEKDEFQVI